VNVARRPVARPIDAIIDASNEAKLAISATRHHGGTS
jgi:hypothetical protein